MAENNFEQPVTKKYLGEFTEDVLPPGMSRMLDEKFNSFDAKMDEKFADLRGDLTVLMRKEDRKLLALVEILQNRDIISPDDAKKILALEPFPRIQ